MSRDIRSFFQPKKVTKPKIEDDDIIPESPDVQIQIKKRASRKKRILSDDSDEEIFTSKKKKSQLETSKSTKNKKSPHKPALKEVKVSDLFGNAPVKRTEPLVKKEKKKTEVGIHSDDDFDQSLLELDVDNVSLETKSTNAKFDVEIKKNDAGKIKSPDKKGSRDTGKSKVEISLEIKEENSSRSKHIEKKNEKKRKISESDKQSCNDNDSSKTNESSSSKTISNIIKNEKKTKFREVESDKQSRHDDIDNSKIKEKSGSRAVYNEIKNEKKRKFAEFADSDHRQPENDHSNENKKKKSKSFSESKSHKADSKTNGGVDNGDDSDATIIEDYEESNKHKNKKLDKSLNESVLTDEERHERRRHSAALYQHYLNRSGPKHLGAKEIPEGLPNCLKDCAFLLTGVLDSFERDDIVAAINKYGGSIKNSISKKVTHVLAGEDAGPAKMAKAQELGIKIINEDQFLQMIAKPTTNKTKLDIKKEAEKEKNTTKKDKTPSKKLNGIKDSEVKKEELTKKHDSDVKKVKTSIKDTETNKNQSKSPNESKKEVKIEKVEDSKEDRVVKLQENTCKSTIISPSSLMWVDKYKPQNVKQIIGQHGDASNVKKLTNWLTKWYVNRRAKLPKPNPWAKNDDGGYYKAALLSGPPGVGKTTTVALVCKELGFDMVEFNASDTRNKTLIKEQIGELLTTTSLSGYAKGETGKQAVTKKHVLVMDEVDGMAGNEDRGGLQELISLIKSTSVPIICMCNDRNSQKMRSFVNYCYDLRFSRPRVDQIKSAMMSICFKEGIKIPPDVLTQLIVAASQDVRQTLNLLSLWAADPALLDADKLRRDAQNIRKDIKLGPWEAIRKVFSQEEHKKMSIHDRSDLFFYDYSLAPLFVQENYLQVAPHCPKNEILDRVSRTADSISIGDMVDARIRRAQAWSLLPLQAMYSSVIPGYEMAGHMTGQINFPAWLGKNSRATKMHRLCQEIHAHTRLSTSGSKSSIFLDYCSHLRDAVVTPLVKDRSDGIEQALQILEAYHLLRDDLDSLTEMSLWPGQRNPMILIDSKVKAAMTRSYNKKAVALPYAPGAVRRGKAREDDEYEEDSQHDDDVLQEDSDPENDALIKKKKADKPSANKDKPSSSKDKSNSNKEKASTSKEKKKK